MDQREYFDDIVTPLLSGECDEFLKSIIDTAQLRQTQCGAACEVLQHGSTQVPRWCYGHGTEDQSY
jgi:hypothetical protein